MKSLVVYKLVSAVAVGASQLEENAFTECGTFEASRSGWSPTIEDGFTMELTGGVQVLRFTTQVKVPNKAEVKRRVNSAVEAYVLEFGNKPNKSEMITMEAEVKEALIPLTPANEPKHFNVVISPTNVYVEGGYKQAELILANLRAILGSLPVLPLELATDTSKKLTDMVKDEINTDKFVLGDKVAYITSDELKVSQTSGSVYGSDAVTHVEDGATVTSLQLEYNSFTLFTLKDDLSLAGIKFSKDLTSDVEDGDQVATVILQVTELISLVDDLVLEFGGLVSKEV